MSSRPRLRLNPDIVYPPIPDHVRKESVDRVADACMSDLQENQEDKKTIIVGSQLQTHNTYSPQVKRRKIS